MSGLEQHWLRVIDLFFLFLKIGQRYAGQTDGPAAGLSALATYSALADPTVPVVALDRVTAKCLLDARGVQELPTADEADLEVELWSYKPGMLSEGPAVDRLSLYLSLRDDTDERVHSALDEMMRGVTW